MSTLNKEKLFQQFPPISTDEWMNKINADLKGAPFEKKMVWKTNEGFSVSPFYREENLAGINTLHTLPGEFPFVRGTKLHNNWLIRHDIDVDDPKVANTKAVNAINNGANALGFSLQDKDVTSEMIAILLNGTQPHRVELNLKTCISKAADTVQCLNNYLTKIGVNKDTCTGSVDYNPFRATLSRGAKTEPWTEQAIHVIHAAQTLPRFKTLAVDAFLFNDAGATLAQELGFALAWGNQLLTKLTDAGLTVDDVAQRVKFNFGVSANYFMEIAKFRAARWLWACIVDAYTPANSCATKLHAHAQTSKWNMTVYDAHVNLLRSQTEAMAAALAGVDSITVTPFDAVYKKSDDFSERIARNQQLLLKEECHFDQVVDPAGGSYYIEVLTQSLVNAAWKIFLDVTDQGGFQQAIESGFVQKTVNDAAAARRKAVATRREILLGTNQYPNFNETAKDKIQVAEGCTCGNGETPATTPLDFSRGASEFEKLRLATENHGKIPVVFMLTIGNLAMRLARSQFSSNFFACAGYKIVDNLGFETIDDGIKAATDAQADIIVLCSSDEEYATLAPEAFDKINALGKKIIFVVAGAPACTDELKSKGITNFINVKSNVLDTLLYFNQQLGI